MAKKWSRVGWVYDSSCGFVLQKIIENSANLRIAMSNSEKDQAAAAEVEDDDMMVRIDDESRTQNDAHRRVLIILTNQGSGCQQHLCTKGFVGMSMDGWGSRCQV